MRGAIVFDLDETLYPERRFALSGFRAVAVEVERLFGVPACQGFGVLRRALTRGDRRRALQILCERFGLPTQMVDQFRTVIRTHAPALRLPVASRKVLEALSASWKLGILTNGLPATQANKIAALGVETLVDAVVYADQEEAKPHPTAFARVFDRLGAKPAASIFVGDDPWCDIAGARLAGMKTIRVCRGVHARLEAAQGCDADAHVASISEVPSRVCVLAERDIKEVGHAA